MPSRYWTPSLALKDILRSGKPTLTLIVDVGKLDGAGQVANHPIQYPAENHSVRFDASLNHGIFCTSFEAVSKRIAGDRHDAAQHDQQFPPA
jgi:hypothetical protein